MDGMPEQDTTYRSILGVCLTCGKMISFSFFPWIPPPPPPCPFHPSPIRSPHSPIFYIMVKEDCKKTMHVYGPFIEFGSVPLLPSAGIGKPLPATHGENEEERDKVTERKGGGASSHEKTMSRVFFYQSSFYDYVPLSLL
jgi:hypothetical protein